MRPWSTHVAGVYTAPRRTQAIHDRDETIRDPAAFPLIRRHHHPPPATAVRINGKSPLLPPSTSPTTHHQVTRAAAIQCHLPRSASTFPHARHRHLQWVSGRHRPYAAANRPPPRHQHTRTLCPLAIIDYIMYPPSHCHHDQVYHSPTSMNYNGHSRPPATYWIRRSLKIDLFRPDLAAHHVADTQDTHAHGSLSPPWTAASPLDKQSHVTHASDLPIIRAFTSDEATPPPGNGRRHHPHTAIRLTPVVTLSPPCRARFPGTGRRSGPDAGRTIMTTTLRARAAERDHIGSVDPSFVDRAPTRRGHGLRQRLSVISMRGSVGAIERTRHHSRAGGEDRHGRCRWWTRTWSPSDWRTAGSVRCSRPKAYLDGSARRGAGQVVRTALLAASSAYDYHLQAQQVALRHAVGGSCAGGCQAHELQATLSLQIHAVAIGAALLLVSNLVVVGWTLAFRGGRLEIGSTRPRSRTGGRTTYVACSVPHSSPALSCMLPSRRGSWPTGVRPSVPRGARRGGASSWVSWSWSARCGWCRGAPWRSHSAPC